MDLKTVFPELRRFLDNYDLDDALDRLDELMAYRQPFAVTADNGTWVMVPAPRYDDLVDAMVALSTVIEQQRQQSEPLPKL